MATLAYQPAWFNKITVAKKSDKTQLNTTTFQRTFDFDLARLQERVNDETVEVPYFDKKQDLLDWIKNGE